MTTMTRSFQSVIRQCKRSLWRLIFDHKNRTSLNLDQPAKILFDQKEDLIGDMLVNTVAFRALKTAHPDWTIHVLAGATNRDVISSNPHVDKIHTYSGLWSTIKSLKRERFDIYYFHKNKLALRDFILLKHVASKVNVGRNKSGFELFDYSIDAPTETEFDRFARFLQWLGVDDVDCRYEFHLTREELLQAQSYVAQLSASPVIAFNRYGHRRGKLFSRSRAMQLIREINRAYPEAAIVLLCSPATQQQTIGMQRELQLGNVHVAASTQTIRDSAAILYYADLAVSPDTSIVHIACAFGKPQICIYRDQNELTLWRPMSDKAIVLLPRSPSRHVDDVDLAEFTHALETARVWLPPQSPQK